MVVLARISRALRGDCGGSWGATSHCGRRWALFADTSGVLARGPKEAAPALRLKTAAGGRSVMSDDTGASPLPQQVLWFPAAEGPGAAKEKGAADGEEGEQSSDDGEGGGEEDGRPGFARAVLQLRRRAPVCRRAPGLCRASCEEGL